VFQILCWYDTSDVSYGARLDNDMILLLCLVAWFDDDMILLLCLRTHHGVSLQRDWTFMELVMYHSTYPVGSLLFTVFQPSTHAE
jgi:hypothetical protein